MAKKKNKKNKGRQKKARRQQEALAKASEYLAEAMEAEKRIIEYGEAAAAALNMEGVPVADSPEDAIRERMAGLLYAAAMMALEYVPPALAGEQYYKIARASFSTATLRLAAVRAEVAPE